MIDVYFERVNNYLISIVNNTISGFYEFEVGIPNEWYMKSNSKVECELIVNVEDEGKIYKIAPKNSDVKISEIFEFIDKTIKTNIKIADMEKTFNDKVTSDKERIKNEVNEFYGKISKLREESFDKMDDDEAVDTIMSEIEKLTNEVKKREIALCELDVSNIDESKIEDDEQ